MRIIFFILVFFISSLVNAEDISDFQIEGISIGDSLLKYYDEDYILDYSYDYYGTDVLNFDLPELDYKSASEYDGIQVAFIKNDPKYSAIQIAGAIFYDTKSKNMDSCLKKKDQIVNDLTKQLKIIFSDGSFSDEEGDYYISLMEYENGDLIRVFCSDWNNKTEKNKPTIGLSSTYPQDMPKDHSALPVWNSENWFYEDVIIDHKIRSLRRTISEGEAMQFNMMVLDMHPYVADEYFATKEGIFTGVYSSYAFSKKGNNFSFGSYSGLGIATFRFGVNRLKLKGEGTAYWGIETSPSMIIGHARFGIAKKHDIYKLCYAVGLGIF